MASSVSFLRRFVSVARGMPSAERKASNVCVPKNASRMIRNAHESETMSSVRATEQFRSRRATPDWVTTDPGDDLADGLTVWTLAVAGISDGLFAQPDHRPFRRCARLAHHPRLTPRKYKSSYACNKSLVMHVIKGG